MLGRFVVQHRSSTKLSPWVNRNSNSIYVCTHMQSHAHPFSQGLMTLTQVCDFFHSSVHYTPPLHHQRWSRGTQDVMSVKAWEREERSWACSHRPDSWFCVHNKDLWTRARHPSGWSRHMRRHTWIQIHTTHVRTHNLTYLHKHLYNASKYRYNMLADLWRPLWLHKTNKQKKRV